MVIDKYLHNCRESEQQVVKGVGMGYLRLTQV